MLRKILAAVVGYIIMVVVVLAGIGIAWLVLGAKGAFAGEGPAPSTVWMTVNVVSGFVAAIIGGWAALKIGRSPTAPKILAGIVLALGLFLAVTAALGETQREPLDKPVAQLSFTEAGRHVQQPGWYNWVIPLVGAVGVLVGGRQRG